jgi:hypothetical protein
MSKDIKKPAGETRRYVGIDLGDKTWLSFAVKGLSPFSNLKKADKTVPYAVCHELPCEPYNVPIRRWHEVYLGITHDSGGGLPDPGGRTNSRLKEPCRCGSPRICSFLPMANASR